MVYALSCRPHVFSIMPLNMNLWEKILKLQLQDEFYKEVKFELEIEIIRTLKYEGYALNDDGLLWFYGRIYVPLNDEIHNFDTKIIS